MDSTQYALPARRVVVVVFVVVIMGVIMVRVVM
jgi:hypothetical protein